jgi:DNA-binding MarR family transcriptional regulator
MIVFDARVSEVSRRLRARADVILGVVWYTPEARDGYPGLPCAPGTASLASRAACLGRVRGAAVAAIFASIEPSVVAKAIDEAWAVADPETFCQARLDASVRALKSVIGDDAPGLDRALELLCQGLEGASREGHPMYMALRALPWPGTKLGDLWRACDMVREHRGDSHVNAWVSMGLHPVEVNVLSELWRNVPLGSVTMMQMGWSRRDLEAAVERLTERGLVTRGELTEEGRRVREEIETATDAQERSLVEALGDDAEELLELLDPWARAIATNYLRP